MCGAGQSAGWEELCMHACHYDVDVERKHHSIEALTAGCESGCIERA